MRGSSIVTPEPTALPPRTGPLNIAIGVAFAVVPFLLLLIPAALILHSGPQHFIPTSWNDQVGAWIRIASFRAVGLNTGYFAPNEILAPIANSRLGVEGPFFTIFLGALSVVIPWTTQSALYLNVAVVGLALAVYVITTRPDRVQIAFLIVLLASAWPVLVYLPTSSEEPFNIAIAIVLAVGFRELMDYHKRLGWVATASFGIVIVLAALERFSWAILLVPYALLVVRGRTSRWKLGAFAVAVAAIVVVLKFQDQLVPPVGNAIFERLHDLGSSPLSALGSTAALGWHNLVMFVNPAAAGSSGSLDFTAQTTWARVTTVAQSYEILGLAAISIAQCVWLVRKGRHADALAMFNAFNLIVITLASVFLYLPLGYYRLLGAHLLLTSLLLLSERRIALVGALIVINLATTPGFVKMYQTWKPNFLTPATTLSAERQNVASVLRYEPHAPSPWCNTVMLPLEAYDQRVLAIPPGLGISYVLSALSLPIKSRWVFAEKPQDPSYVKAIGGFDHFRRVALTSIGTLYENPRSPCFQPRR
jgi:hypothetical protein